MASTVEHQLHAAAGAEQVAELALGAGDARPCGRARRRRA